MNLFMQLRKVCNHPELFERKPNRSPFLFNDEIDFFMSPAKFGDI